MLCAFYIIGENVRTDDLIISRKTLHIVVRREIVCFDVGSLSDPANYEKNGYALYPMI